MSISLLQQFRQKSQLGADEVDRLRVNEAGTKVDRPGRTRTGRTVQQMSKHETSNTWSRGQFVRALKAEYGDQIGSKLEPVVLGLQSKKPLGSRETRQIFHQADTLRANRTTAELFAPKDRTELGDAPPDRGYMSAVRAAKDATGASDALVAVLVDSDSFSYSSVVRGAIRTAIEAAGENGTRVVTDNEAQAIAQQKIEDFLHIRMANEATMNEVLAAGEPAAKAAELADTLGVPTLADAFTDAASPAAQALKDRTAKSPSLPSDRLATPAEVKAAMLGRTEQALVEHLARDHLASLQQLPPDLELATRVAKGITSVALGEGAPPERAAAAAALFNGEIGRLGVNNTENPDHQALAWKLNDALLANLARIPDPDIKRTALTRERDRELVSARTGGGHAAWQRAASLQNNIIAVELQRLGEPLTAQTKDRLTALADRSPDLAAAMRDMNEVEQQYVRAQGGDPDRVSLGWADARSQLAELRDQAHSLDEPSGNELQAFIANKMRALTASMIAKAMQVLGPPPQQFAAISLGSASRGEASPYSDVEFAILLDGPKEPGTDTKMGTDDYMRRLSELVHFQVTNLGENGGNLVTPNGFHWDSGNNTPLESPDKFIGDARSLIAGNLRETEGGKPSEMFGLTMFSNAELLYGSREFTKAQEAANFGFVAYDVGRTDTREEKDWALVKDFQKQVNTHFAGSSEVVSGPRIGRARSGEPDELGLEAVRTKSPTKGQVLGAWMMKEGVNEAKLRAAMSANVVDVKALSRLPMMLAQGLALERGIHADATKAAANSTLSRLDALVAAKVLNREEADTLAKAFTKLGEIRVKAHLHAGKADDEVYLDPAEAQAAGGFAAPELRQVMLDLLPFVQRIEQHGTAARPTTERHQPPIYV